MTDDTSTSDNGLDPTAWLAREQEFARRCESIRPENKAALFDAFAQAGITSVEVTFDGYGDSGQIEDITARAADKDVALPAVSVEIARAQWGNPDIIRATHSLNDAIELLAYDFLRDTHAGWEDNDGAFGDFIFDAASRSITLNYNARIETSECTEHVF